MLVSFRFKQFTDDMEEVDRLRTVKHNFILGIIIRRFKTVLESTHHIICDSIYTMGPTEKSKAKALEHTFEIDGADDNFIEILADDGVNALAAELADQVHDIMGSKIIDDKIFTEFIINEDYIPEDPVIAEAKKA